MAIVFISFSIQQVVQESKNPGFVDDQNHLSNITERKTLSNPKYTLMAEKSRIHNQHISGDKKITDKGIEKRKTEKEEFECETEDGNAIKIKIASLNSTKSVPGFEKEMEKAISLEKQKAANGIEKRQNEKEAVSFEKKPQVTFSGLLKPF